MNKIVSLVLAVGGVAFTLLAVGFFTPGWLVFDLISIDMQIYASYGLFSSSLCIKLGSSSECIGMEALDGSDYHMDFEPETVLGVILCLGGAWFCCMMAITLTIDISRRHCFAKTRLLVIDICWILTAVLIFVAVGLQAHENAKAEDTLKAADIDLSFLKMKTPWSIAIAGVGAMFAVINSVLMAILYFWYTPSDEPIVSQWYPFQNETVDQKNHSQNVAYPGAVFKQENQQRNMAQMQFPVLEQGKRNLNLAYPGPMNAQGIHIKNISCLQLCKREPDLHIGKSIV